ncbi:MAG TPA: RnfH family protein [Burkholderiales bacterium]
MKSIRVEVVCARPGAAEARTLRLPAGSRVADALAAAGLPVDGKVGIFGRVVSLDKPLADGDRVELYRALALEPKEARRRRAARRR